MVSEIRVSFSLYCSCKFFFIALANTKLLFRFNVNPFLFLLWTQWHLSDNSDYDDWDLLWSDIGAMLTAALWPPKPPLQVRSEKNMWEEHQGMFSGPQERKIPLCIRLDEFFNGSYLTSLYMYTHTHTYKYMYVWFLFLVSSQGSFMW